MTHLALKEDNTRHSANICRKTVQIGKWCSLSGPPNDIV